MSRRLRSAVAARSGPGVATTASDSGGASGGGTCATGGVSRIGGTGEKAPLFISTIRMAAAAPAISMTTAIAPTISSGTSGEDRRGGG